MNTKNTTETIYTTNLSTLYKACVIQAYSDHGQLGWMVCREMRLAPYTGKKTPEVFFGINDKEAAVQCARDLDL